MVALPGKFLITPVMVRYLSFLYLILLLSTLTPPNNSFAVCSVTITELGASSAVEGLPAENSKLKIFSSSGSANIAAFLKLILPLAMSVSPPPARRATASTSGIRFLIAPSMPFPGAPYVLVTFPDASWKLIVT